ncbi:MAG: hypothetical protein JW759_07305 [Candidatus Coatesbacteria bacterium]|nr:hypothetical protein [Candidatus Coatesbacteria bacterium]
MSRFEYLEIERNRGLSAAERDSDDTPEVLISSAWNLYWEGAYEEALRLLSRVLRLEYLNATAWSGQVWCLVELDELREADVWADKAIDELGEVPGAISGKAAALARQGFAREAMLWTDKAVSCSHKREDQFASMTWVTRAELLLRKGNRRSINLCVSQASAFSGVGWRAELAAGRACLYNGSHVLAVEFLSRASERCPLNHFIWCNLARAHKGLGHLRQAELSVERALELKPSSREAAQLQRELAASAGGLSSVIKRLFG